MRFRLNELASIRWGRNCPCCGKGMTYKLPRPYQPHPPTLRTKGHDEPLARGGNPYVWLFVCAKCNEDQADLRFEAWARKLAWHRDARVDRVRAVATLIEEYRNGKAQTPGASHVEDAHRAPQRPQAGGALLFDPDV